VTVDLKRGTLVNEMTQFRYDVTLRRDQAPKVASPAHWLDWNDGELTLDQVRDRLAAELPETLGIAGIPNARTSAPMKALELVDGSSVRNVGEVRRQVEEMAHDGVDPEMLWAVGRELGYGVAIGLLGSGGNGRYDVVFRRAGGSSPSTSFGFQSGQIQRGGNVAPHVTNPVAGVKTQSLVAALRNYLQTRLPEYMVPSSIVLLDRLPQTPNGKVDRRALPAPDTVRGGSVDTYLAPRNRTERVLAAIWADVLNVDRVGVSDNFFELGGHSLLATQLVSRIRIEFKNEMPVRAIFEAPTVAALAVKLDQQAGNGQRASGYGIGRIPRSDAAVAGTGLSRQVR
jgi:acyl carrier protein